MDLNKFIFFVIGFFLTSYGFRFILMSRGMIDRKKTREKYKKTFFYI
jgi:hypothetical protein